MASPDDDGAAAIAGIIDRPRLFRILDSRLVRVCVVQGPSGSGKTTLLRSWALQQQPAPTWVSLGSGATNRQAFWRRVAASAKRLGALSDADADRVDEQLNAGADPVRIASALLAGAGPVTLVFDAYEHLGDAMREIDDDLAKVLAAAPELRLMITTRAGTALTDLALAEGVVRVVALGELALTTDEVGALVAAQTGIRDEALARSVTEATRGFALTVRAVVLALSQLGRIPRVDSREWDAVVAVRLESLLPDPVAVRFVTDTSVAPYVDVELAQRLSGHPDAAGLLDTLERNGFGRWIPYAHHRPVFQYVETIRDSFRARSVDDPERFRLSCAVTAAWLFDNDEADQALAFAIDGEEYAFADRIFVALLIGNPDSYITDRFLPVLRDLPDAVLTAHPMLAFGLGLALGSNPILRMEATRVYHLAIDSPARPEYLEPTVDAFSLAAMKAISLRTAYRFRESAVACREVARTVEDMPPALLAQFGDHVGTILRQLSYSMLQGGMYEDALANIGRSVALCQTQRARNYSIVYAAAAHAFTGNIARAKAVLASIDTDAWPVELRRTYMNAPGLIAETYAQVDAMDFEGAVKTLRESEAYIQTAEFWPFLATLSVTARQGRGQAHAAAQQVTRELTGAVPPPGTGDNVATASLHGAVARAWIAAGDLRAAGRLLDSQRADSVYTAAARIELLLSAERDREALALSDELLAAADHTLRTRAETLTVAAVAALRRAETERAWDWLSEAAVTWETYGPRHHVAMLTTTDRRSLLDLSLDRDSSLLRRYLELPAGRSVRQPAVVLTPRERIVLAAFARHDSVREVAAALVVSPHTVKTQLQGVYRKLGVSSRRAALTVAHELGLLEDT